MQWFSRLKRSAMHEKSPVTILVTSKCSYDRAWNRTRGVEAGRRIALCLAMLTGLVGGVLMSTASGQTIGADASGQDEQLNLTVGKQKLRLPASMFDFSPGQLEQIRQGKFPPILGFSFSLCWPELKLMQSHSGGRALSCDRNRIIAIRDVRFGNDRNPNWQAEKDISNAKNFASQVGRLVEQLPVEQQIAAETFFRITGIKLISFSSGWVPGSKYASTFVRVNWYPNLSVSPQKKIIDKIVDITKPDVNISAYGWVESKSNLYSYQFISRSPMVIDDWPNTFDRIDSLVRKWTSLDN